MKHTTVAVYICSYGPSSVLLAILRPILELCNRTLFLNFNFIQDCLGGKRVGGDIRRIFFLKKKKYI
jgi:hypothetical protein